MYSSSLLCGELYFETRNDPGNKKLKNTEYLLKMEVPFSTYIFIPMIITI